MACLILVITNGYVNLAEEFLLKVMKDKGEKDMIIGSRYSGEIIGALILRLERNGNRKDKKAKSGKTRGKGIVRAWTTRPRYSGAGVGTAMLEEAVKATREKLGNSAEVTFAAEHANSRMILPELFNEVFRRREAKAARALMSVVERMEPGK
jgi:ribosomal protein S18 acetylase RimI-like enzyme